MSLISQIIDNLLNGVSQQPDPLRLPSQGEVQTNGFTKFINGGPAKRPPTEHVATLDEDSTGYDSALVHPITISADQRFFAIVANGDLKVFNKVTGEEVTVAFPDAKGYLAGTGPFRAISQGDITYIVDTSKVALKGSEAADAEVREALIVIQQGDFGTTYNIVLNGVTMVVGSSEGVTPFSRSEIATDNIALKLKTLIDDSGDLSGFTITRYGSTLHIVRSDNEDFTISGGDGLADNGLIVIKGSVQAFTDLPNKAPHGFVVQVTGDATNKFDNYYVTFDDLGTPEQSGVWRETVKPGEIISLDAATLPHILAFNGSYIGDSESEGPPPEPIVAPGGGTEETENWDSIAFNGRALINGDGDHVNAALGEANGIETEYTVYFDVDTRNAQPENPATIALSYETGGIGSDVWVVAASRVYEPEVTLRNQSLSARLTLNAGERISLGLTYADGDPPNEDSTAKFYTAVLSVGGLLHGGIGKAPAAIFFVKRTGKSITFKATSKYPGGATVRAVVEGVNYDYLIPGGDRTGAQIATALTATINAGSGINATNPTSGVILVQKDDESDLTVTCSVINFAAGTSFHCPDLSLTPDALIGMTIYNDTDNSSGVVTDNTETTIAVASLTGGADNTFAKEDFCRVVGDTPYFLFAEALWKNRVAGDLTLNPFPSFIGKPISEVFFYRNRFGVCSRENIVLAQSGQPLNFFRQTVTALLDDDVIDVKPASGASVSFHSAAVWYGKLLANTDKTQYVLDGKPLLTPASVALDPISNYTNASLRPLVLGTKLYFCRGLGRFTKVYEYAAMQGTDELKGEADDITRLIPKYIPGDPVQMTGDPTGFFAILADASRRTLYVYNFHFENQQKFQSCWSKWTLPAGSTIIGMDLLDGTIALVIKRASGVFLETLDLDEVEDASAEVGES